MARCEICGKRAGFMVDVCSSCVEAKKSGKPLPENKAWIAARASRRKGLWLGGITGAAVGIVGISLQGVDPLGPEASWTSERPLGLERSSARSWAGDSAGGKCVSGRAHEAVVELPLATDGASRCSAPPLKRPLDGRGMKSPVRVALDRLSSRHLRQGAADHRGAALGRESAVYGRPGSDRPDRRARHGHPRPSLEELYP